MPALVASVVKLPMETIREWLRRLAFRPFETCLSSGEIHRVRHQESTRSFTLVLTLTNLAESGAAEAATAPRTWLRHDGTGIRRPICKPKISAAVLDTTVGYVILSGQ